MADKDEKNVKFTSSEVGEHNLADDPKLRLLAFCIISQQDAGFKDGHGNTFVDLRQGECPTCKGAGFNTGWGFWKFVCGAEILNSEGDYIEPCGAVKAPAAA